MEWRLRVSIVELAERTEDFPGCADGHKLTIRAKDRGCDRRVMRCNDLLWTNIVFETVNSYVSLLKFSNSNTLVILSIYKLDTIGISVLFILVHSKPLTSSNPYDSWRTWSLDEATFHRRFQNVMRRTINIVRSSHGNLDEEVQNSTDGNRCYFLPTCQLEKAIRSLWTCIWDITAICNRA